SANSSSLTTWRRVSSSSNSTTSSLPGSDNSSRARLTVEPFMTGSRQRNRGTTGPPERPLNRSENGLALFWIVACTPAHVVLPRRGRGVLAVGRGRDGAQANG